jgi:antitoxin component YwqK of YwqJK toxin-antitoxin module
MVFAQLAISLHTANCRAEKRVYGTVMNLHKKFKNINMVQLTETATQIRNGKWKEFNKHGVLIAEGMYVNDKKQGTWTEYYDQSGSKMIEEDYRYGVQHGRFISYHPNGRIFSQGQFVNGLREGYFKAYDEFGKNTRTIFFVNNIQIRDGAESPGNGDKERQRQQPA